MNQKLFNLDPLAIITAALIFLISSIIFIYSKTYLRADSKKTAFLVKTLLLAAFLIFAFAANHIALLGVFWILSNLTLVSLMVHKAKWQQAKNSGILALRNFAIGSASLILALMLLRIESGSSFIDEIVGNENLEKKILIICGLLLLITALSQSAIFPFNSWLLSSLNSPTPASALMHAGLVNGGGIVLARFAPLFFKMPEILTVIFVFGIFSAIIGGIWKLLQSNVKSMLACSTISQMGFMIAQCGLGLFPAAIAHLFWHGMFKSYLFLASPSAWRERRLDLNYPPKIISFALSLFLGMFGAVIFAKINFIEVGKFNANLVLLALCFIAASQISLTILNNSPLRNFLPALVISSLSCAVYGFSVSIIEKIIPAQYLQPQSLNFWHFGAIFILFGMWLIRLFIRAEKISNNSVILSFYVKALNASQAKAQTITSNRNQYKF